LSFFLRQRYNLKKPSGALRAGVSHGGICLACCWAEMAVLVALGTMNIGWMLAIAALIFLEKATPAARQARAERAARRLIVKAAADLLSGPGGLASYLRTRLAPGTVASVSLPLDAGALTETIPVHLRRAVAVRDRGCRFPGCDQPAAACHPHHIIPRAQGGPASLTNLMLLCSFHHLIAVHRWGWNIALHPDGTVTATSPDGDKTLHSHGPPPAAAA